MMVIGLSSWGFADQTLFQSGNQQVNLVELYSSEGCSSCPPADRWVASLKNHQELWQSFVPINFHVDYWDRLGWVDRFANQSFSQRQRRYAQEWQSGRVYTPGFVKNGKEWRPKVARFAKGVDVGNLIVKESKGRIIVEFKNLTPQSDLKVYIALLGHGLSTKVKAGENLGETLNHEFVVLDLNSQSMKKLKEHYQAVVAKPTNNTAKPKTTSLAVWVTSGDSLKPLQATGGFL